MPRQQSKNEPGEERGSSGKQYVTGNTHPAQRLHVSRWQEPRRARVPGAVLDRCPRLEKADRQQAEKNHEAQADIERPEGILERSFLPRALRPHRPHAEERETKPEHSVHAEEGSVPVK